MLAQGQRHIAGEWQEQWHRIQTCTDAANREQAQTAVAELYRAVGEKEPKFFWFDSPLAMYLSMVSPSEIVAPDVWPPFSLMRRVSPATYDRYPPPQLNEDMGKPMVIKFRQAMELGLLERAFALKDGGHLLSISAHSSSIANLILNAFSDWMQVRSATNARSWMYARSSRRMGLFLHNTVFGQFDASWLGPYQYWRQVSGYRFAEIHEQMLDAWTFLAKSCGWGVPHERCCLLCERPERIGLNGQGLLHGDKEPAVRYRDGCAIWALNGVAVPRWLAEPPAENLDARRVLEIDNAEVRREFVRKVGMERICTAFRAVRLDRQGIYELIRLDLGNNRRRPYLKMLNPSTGASHIEGVDPSCQTVAEALKWRNGTDVAPTTLT
jgi:hypothetical protein